MTLNYEDREVPTATGVNRLGRDADGNRVVVSASNEVLQDYDWSTAWQAGEVKYARGSYVQEGETRVVRVTTDDCAG